MGIGTDRLVFSTSPCSRFADKQRTRRSRLPLLRHRHGRGIPRGSRGAVRARFLGSDPREGEPSRCLVTSKLGGTRARLECVRDQRAGAPDNVSWNTWRALARGARCVRAARAVGRLGAPRRRAQPTIDACWETREPSSAACMPGARAHPENIPLDTRTMLGDVASLARCATPRGQLGGVRRSLLYLAERPVTRRDT